ncbi:hypothetical protein CTI12_AA619740 [Artemisia annua]|uniref:Uncharacterized protein n=1 Tax=Artemisia annua TaxID=35608 RepID=A0A2U1KCA8_ARTAN|nr:hypothetical protein CTI12_AA619740 [Artemisia annua]
MTPPGAPGNTVRDLNVPELNDTIVEAQLRIRQISPLLQVEEAAVLFGIEQSYTHLDPKTTALVLSGCHHSVFDENFGEFNIWLCAEHGVFLRTPNKEWIRNLPEVQMDWVDSVKCLTFGLTFACNCYVDFELSILASFTIKTKDYKVLYYKLHIRPVAQSASLAAPIKTKDYKVLYYSFSVVIIQKQSY